MTYDSIEALINEAVSRKEKLSTIVLEDQAAELDRSAEDIYKEMEASFKIMQEAVRAGSNKGNKSTSGLTGGEGYKMLNYSTEKNGGLSGTEMTRAMARALAVSGYNAAMGRIVAAPTAGSCGILPGCLVTLYEDRDIELHDIIMAHFTAAAVGMVIARRACIAGAEGGCQAECGSASAMAAAALVELGGGTPEQIDDAVSTALSQQMGLVCDPVAGLVEIPCIKRNASGVMIAFASADMVLAGMKAEIPADECIDAMGAVGRQMSENLKETAMGGLATTPTGQKLKEKVFGK